MSSSHDANGRAVVLRRGRKVGELPVSREAHSRALAAAGIPDRVRIYDLRHTGLTRLHEAGVPELTLKYLAGHEKLQTTVRYVRIGNEAKLDALQKLERYKRARSA